MVELDTHNTININETTINMLRKFGSSQSFIPCKIILENRHEVNALFTSSQIHIAVERARKNQEDIERLKVKSFFSKLFRR